MEQLELKDIQGIIPRGYGSLTAACYLLLAVREPGAARAWLGALADRITAGDVSPQDSALNVAFTFSGLSKLGVPEETLTTFPEEFAGGIATPYRQRLMGDVDESAPDRWDWGGPATRPVDVLLMLFAASEQKLDELYSALSGEIAAGGLDEVKKLETFNLGEFEHFGFRDGISQPIIEGLPKAKDAASIHVIKPGEFVLGYRNEYGLYTDSPTVSPKSDPASLLPPVSEPSGKGDRNHDLGRNGSYLVFRQISQDIKTWRDCLDRSARNPDGTGNPDLAALLGAKMVGRWESGAPVVLAPEQDNPSLGTENDFRYHSEDPDGYKCPIGSHVRRTNPRDSLDPRPGSRKSIAIGKRHRILRRGREFGRPFTEETAGEERGLHFICINANISRQFEFIQHTWLNNPKFDELFNDADPLTGTHSPQGGIFRIPGQPVRRRILDLPQFVTVRGGAYFFLPGIRAIRYLASVGR